MAEQLTDYQKDILIRTALGEARGEGVEGMADVIQVILNRANSGEFPSDPAAAALQPNEFSTWNKGAGGNNPGQFSTNSDTYKSGQRALELVLSGTRPDYTGGALFYKMPAVKSPFHDSQNKYGTIERNGHLFYPTRPVPPGEIPNQVASLTDTIAPRVAPNPVTISPELRLARNPLMSVDAQNAQVTPSGNVPLPRNRPSAPDIVTPSMAALNAPRGNVNATRAVDMLATTQNPVTPRLTAAGDNIYSYHIPDMTPTTVTGGLGSLTPTPARARLPELPPSNIGQPPTTRVVQSVPFNTPPASSMPRPTSAQINDAARRASLMGTQSNVERAIPTTPMAPTAPQSFNPRARDSNYAANTALGERVAAQMAPVFNQPGFIPNRLVPNPIVQPSFVPLNQPPIQVVPSAFPTLPMASGVPLPRRRPVQQMQQPMRQAAPMRQPQQMPRMGGMGSPLRIVINGGNMIEPQRTSVQSLQSSGLSPSDAYAMANAQAQQRARDNATSAAHTSSNSWFNEVTGRG